MDGLTRQFLSSAELGFAGDVGMLDFMLRAGAEVNEPDQNGRSALILTALRACEYPHRAFWRFRRVLRLLLTYGADINSVDHECQTALGWAAANGRKDIVRFLLASGADVNARCEHGRTALMTAIFCTGHLPRRARRKYVPVIRTLLASGAEVDIADDMGNTALSLALTFGQKNIVKLLLAHGATVRSMIQ